MAAEDNFVVAIEIGSSKVTAIAGRKQPDDALLVLACVQEPSSDFVSRGRINNIKKMKACLSGIKENLEKKLKKSIGQAYVGIGGMGMYSVKNTVPKTFTARTEVSRDVIDEIEQDNARSMSDEHTILGTIIQEYRLGAQVTHEPVGMIADRVEGRFLNVVTRNFVCENIKNCMNDAELGIAGLPIATLALADRMVPASERHSGCVFVDMGAETTSVAIFKNNLLRHFAVLPLGGRNITRDITSLSVEEAEAERMKVNFGTAFSENDEEVRNPIVTDSGRHINYDEFINLVEARQEEIICNVHNQIKLSGYKRSELVGGIILTGGAANMRNIVKAFRRITDFETVRVVKSVDTTIRPASSLPQGFNKDGSCNMAIALLEQGKENCCAGSLSSGNDMFDRKKKEEEAEKERLAREAGQNVKGPQEPSEAVDKERVERERAEKRAEKKEKRRRFFGKIKNFMTNLVSDNEANEGNDVRD